jgi:hypothetical protein
MPMLGAFDYDSVMLYTSNRLDAVDRLGNRFDRTLTAGPSRRDVSRLLQYYAQERQPKWGLFNMLSPIPASPDDAPDPFLAEGVSAVGTPAVVHRRDR